MQKTSGVPLYMKLVYRQVYMMTYRILPALNGLSQYHLSVIVDILSRYLWFVILIKSEYIQNSISEQNCLHFPIQG